MTSLIRVLLSCVVLLVVGACDTPYPPAQVTDEGDDTGRDDGGGGNGY